MKISKTLLFLLVVFFTIIILFLISTFMTMMIPVLKSYRHLPENQLREPNVSLSLKTTGYKYTNLC